METTAHRLSEESRTSDSLTANPAAAFERLERSIRRDLSVHDPVPLFLSDPESEPDPREFTGLPARARSGLVSQIVAGALALSAIAVLVALFYSDLSRFLVVNARASLRVATEQPRPAPPLPALARQSPLKDVARVSNTMALASAEATDAVTPALPSRDTIANAYQAAIQSRTETQPPVAAPPPQEIPPAKTLDAATLAGLMSRARSLLDVGDIAAARLLLERAAHAQDASAAFLLAQTYDPAVLGTSDSRSIIADPALARDWYRKAAQLGSSDATQRLAELQN